MIAALKSCDFHPLTESLKKENTISRSRNSLNCHENRGAGSARTSVFGDLMGTCSPFVKCCLSQRIHDLCDVILHHVDIRSGGRTIGKGF